MWHCIRFSGRTVWVEETSVLEYNKMLVNSGRKEERPMNEYRGNMPRPSPGPLPPLRLSGAEKAAIGRKTGGNASGYSS